MYPTVKDNPDYTTIINDRQHGRLQEILSDARDKGAEVIEVNPGNEYFGEDTRRMPPHLILNATDDMRVLREEVFGPLLPIVTYDRMDEALDYINDRPHPWHCIISAMTAPNRSMCVNTPVPVVSASTTPWYMSARTTCPLAEWAILAWAATMVARDS